MIVVKVLILGKISNDKNPLTHTVATPETITKR